MPTEELDRIGVFVTTFIAQPQHFHTTQMIRSKNRCDHNESRRTNIAWIFHDGNGEYPHHHMTRSN